MAWLTESDLEEAMLGWLGDMGHAVLSGADLAPETERRGGLRRTHRDAILARVLREALAELNPQIPEAAREEAAKRVEDVAFSDALLEENRRLHGLLVGGVPITWFEDGDERSDRARLVDWEDGANRWHAVNQVDLTGRSIRRPDVLIYLNGLPIVVVELKGVEGGTLEDAFNQIETYKDQVPELFRANLLSMISDGVNARYGSLSAGLDRFMRWRTVDGEGLAAPDDPRAVETLVRGLLSRRSLLDMLRWFAVFEDEERGAVKKIAGYHQFHAVRKGVEAVRVAREGDGRGGVFWHTQGSGKSLLMTFLAGRLMHDPGMENPTLVVLTDRNDLDDQLFGTFGRCRELLGEAPMQAESVADLKDKLNRQVGGIVFTTIQKFRPERGEVFPELTDRSNVVVLVDEAHRTQYGFDGRIDAGGEVRHGLAHQLRLALPNAVYVAFTGTPVELVGANTLSVFGDYIDVYDIAQAVEDGATVPIYYEGRVAKIDLDEGAVPDLDEAFGEATGELAEGEAEAAKRKWARVEALVGAERRLDAVVADILAHFDARLEAMDGKAMIVCMSRRICVEVHDRIVAARPDWHSEDDAAGAVKVVMTGAASDPQSYQPHVRSKARREGLARRLRDPEDELRLVIVRDMWLTGFDAPALHTLYVDKPMKGHGLMQAIARVNRVFGSKPAGLVVDYIGLAADLRAALAHYSQGDRSSTGIDEREAVAAFLSVLDVARSLMHGLDYAAALDGSPADRLDVLPRAIEHLMRSDQGGKAGLEAPAVKRFRDAVAALVKAFKLASGSQEAMDRSAEVGFLVAVRSALDKLEGSGSRRGSDEADLAIRQMVNQAVASTEIVDILAACGFERPDISVLSEQFLSDIEAMERKNLAVEALRRLLNGEIASRTRTNVARNEAFSKRLQDAIAKYHNRSVDAVQVIQELIGLAKELREEPEDALSEEERAFYDALAMNESAVEVMGNEKLQLLAGVLVQTVRDNAGVDWWRRENVRGRMRVAVKRLLRRFGFPPDLEQTAVRDVIRQAEAIAAEVDQRAAST